MRTALILLLAACGGMPEPEAATPVSAIDTAVELWRAACPIEEVDGLCIDVQELSPEGRCGDDAYRRLLVARDPEFAARAIAQLEGVEGKEAGRLRADAALEEFLALLSEDPTYEDNFKSMTEWVNLRMARLMTVQDAYMDVLDPLAGARIGMAFYHFAYALKHFPVPTHFVNDAELTTEFCSAVAEVAEMSEVKAQESLAWCRDKAEDDTICEEPAF